jgi:hypothetical protein
MQVFTFNPHLIHLLVTTFLTLFLKVFNLQGKDASKSAGNWFKVMMVLFKNEYLPASGIFLCFSVCPQSVSIADISTAGTK